MIYAISDQYLDTTDNRTLIHTELYATQIFGYTKTKVYALYLTMEI